MNTIMKSILFLALLSLSAPAFAQVHLSINIGPPALQVETRVASPIVGGVWVPGYYLYDQSLSNYRWVVGRWQAPPAPQQVWVAPRYVHSGDHYDYYPGRWHDNGKHKGQYKSKNINHGRDMRARQERVNDQGNGNGHGNSHGNGHGNDNDNGNGNGNGKGHGNGNGRGK
jgi:hypothetical protein